MIKALGGIDSEVEIKEMLTIEEQVFSNIFEDKTKAFSSLYHLCTNRIVFLAKVIQKMIKEKKSGIDYESQYFVKMSKDEVQSFKDEIKSLKTEVRTLQNNLTSAEIELEDRKEMYSKLSNKYEDLVYELEMFKGNDRIFKKLELETLFRFEEDLQNSLKVVSKIKNEVSLYYIFLRKLTFIIEITRLRS